MKFALYYIEDAYSTAKKIMGRQNAGKSVLKGVARTWSNGPLHGYGHEAGVPRSLIDQLRLLDYRGTVQWHGGAGRRSLNELGAVYFPAAADERACIYKKCPESCELQQSVRSHPYDLFGGGHGSDCRYGCRTLPALGCADLYIDGSS